MQTEWFLWGLCTGFWAFTGGSIIPIMLLVSIKCIQFVFIFLHHLKALNKHRYGFNLIQLVAWSLVVSQNNLTIFGVLLPSRRYTHSLLFISLILTYSSKEKPSCRKLDIFVKWIWKLYRYYVSICCSQHSLRSLRKLKGSPFVSRPDIIIFSRWSTYLLELICFRPTLVSPFMGVFMFMCPLRSRISESTKQDYL